jgi:hypothetical protein
MHFLVFAAPGSGKSTLLPQVAQALSVSTGNPHISWDNALVADPSFRRETAELLGVNSESPEYRGGIGRSIVLQQVRAVGVFASQNPGFSLLIHSPDRNPRDCINGTPVVDLMVQQYAAVGVTVFPVGLCLQGDGAEEEQVRRLQSRGAAGTSQSAMDQHLVGQVSQRIQNMRSFPQSGLPLIEIPPQHDAEAAAWLIAQTMAAYRNTVE